MPPRFGQSSVWSTPAASPPAADFEGQLTRRLDMLGLDGRICAEYIGSLVTMSSSQSERAQAAADFLNDTLSTSEACTAEEAQSIVDSVVTRLLGGAAPASWTRAAPPPAQSPAPVPIETGGSSKKGFRKGMRFSGSDMKAVVGNMKPTYVQKFSDDESTAVVRPTPAVAAPPRAHYGPPQPPPSTAAFPSLAGPPKSTSRKRNGLEMPPVEVDEEADEELMRRVLKESVKSAAQKGGPREVWPDAQIPTNIVLPNSRVVVPTGVAPPTKQAKAPKKQTPSSLAPVAVQIDSSIVKDIAASVARPAPTTPVSTQASPAVNVPIARGKGVPRNPVSTIAAPTISDVAAERGPPKGVPRRVPPAAEEDRSPSPPRLSVSSLEGVLIPPMPTPPPALPADLLQWTSPPSINEPPASAFASGNRFLPPGFSPVRSSVRAPQTALLQLMFAATAAPLPAPPAAAPPAPGTYSAPHLLSVLSAMQASGREALAKPAELQGLLSSESEGIARQTTSSSQSPQEDFSAAPRDWRAPAARGATTSSARRQADDSRQWRRREEQPQTKEASDGFW